MDKVLWPFGKADVLAPAYAAAIAVTIENRMTIINLTLTNPATLNLTIDGEIEDGALLQLNVTAQDVADDLSLGTAIDGPNIVCAVAGKTKSQSFKLSNGVFRPDGASVQID